MNKIARVDIFSVHFEDKNILAVSSGITLHLQDLLDPPGHRIAQILEVLHGEFQSPQELDLLDQLGD